MRAIIALASMALLAACQVTKDEDNRQVSVEYNQDVAENGAAAVANTAQDIAADIGNDVKREGGKIEQRLGDHDTKAPDSPVANNAN